MFGGLEEFFEQRSIVSVRKGAQSHLSKLSSAALARVRRAPQVRDVANQGCLALCVKVGRDPIVVMMFS